MNDEHEWHIARPHLEQT